MGFHCPYKEAEKGEALQLGGKVQVFFVVIRCLCPPRPGRCPQHGGRGGGGPSRVQAQRRPGRRQTRGNHSLVRRIFFGNVHLSISKFEPDQPFFSFCVFIFCIFVFEPDQLFFRFCVFIFCVFVFEPDQHVF